MKHTIRELLFFSLALVIFGSGGYSQIDRLKELLLAAERGDAEAQFELGLMYDEGYGVSRDNQEAAKWYRKAAEQGDAGAQYLLGYMYDKGKGVPQNYQEAFKWTRKAADQGLAYAQSRLGYMYRDGKGVPQDYAQAHMWYNLASANLTGDARVRAINSRDLVAKVMTREQIAEAQRLALEFKLK